MISFIKGQLAELLDGAIVVEAGGVGYEIAVPASVFETLPKVGEEVKIYTFFKVAEDAVSLYGFDRRSDLSMFKMLLGVNGIGPKGALAIMSSVRTDILRRAIASGDAGAIAMTPGIGIKTAQRVILDLKDKIDTADIFGSDPSQETSSGGNTDHIREAVEAMVSLGYSQAQASKAVHTIDGAAGMPTEDIIRLALRNI